MNTFNIQETDTERDKQKRRVPIFLGFYNYTVIITYLAVPATVIGMAAAFCGKFYLSLVCVMFAGLCDAFDGKVARTRSKSTTTEKNFGIQIDSLVDLVCYGVTPVIIGFNLLVFQTNIVLYSLVFAFYILAAIIRLAYYNVTEEERQKKENGNRKYFRGLPVTSAAIMIPAIFVFYNFVSKAKFANIYTIWLAMIAFLFISNFKLRKPGTKGLIAMIILGTAILVALFVTASVK